MALCGRFDAVSKQFVNRDGYEDFATVKISLLTIFCGLSKSYESNMITYDVHVELCMRNCAVAARKCDNKLQIVTLWTRRTWHPSPFTLIYAK